MHEDRTVNDRNMDFQLGNEGSVGQVPKSGNLRFEGFQI